MLSGVKPFQYQIDDVACIERNNGRILNANDTGLGKAQPLDEIVYTPSGPRRIGDICIGDFVIGADGKPTRVIGVFPQGVKGIAQVTFKDRTTVRCCWDHLWAVRTAVQRYRGSKWRIRTTTQIKDSLQQKHNGESRWFVPVVDPIEFTSDIADRPIDPWLLGYLLGNGSIIYSAQVSTAEQWVVDEIGRLVEPLGLWVKQKSTYDYGIIQRVHHYHNLLIQQLKQVGVYGIKSKHKHIPDAYKYAPIHDRLEILRGLMDADGTIAAVDGNYAEFGPVASLVLANDVCEMIRSLGGCTEVNIKHVDSVPYYRVRANIKENLFKLPRKADLWRPEKQQGRTKAIRKIEDAGAAECVCIKVENADGLYVTSGYTVTHNTLETIWSLNRNPDWLPALVVCPSGVKLNWQYEAQHHFGMSAAICEGRTPPRYNRFDFKVQRSPLTIINYDILKDWVPYLQHLGFKSLICDECQHLMNLTTKRTKAARKVASWVDHIQMLSATPLLNRPVELFPALHILYPQTFPSFGVYTEMFCEPRQRPWGMDYSGATNLDVLNAMLKECGIIRHLKKDVLKDLPEKLRRIVPCELSDPREYAAANDDFMSWLRQNAAHRVQAAKRAESLTKIGMLLQLTARLKLRSAIEWANKFLRDTDEKIVLFACHQKAIEAIHRRVDVKSVVFTGDMTAHQKFVAVKQFQTDPSIRAFIGSRAAWAGNTLTAASTMGIFELFWRPGDMLQAEGRINRIGQTSTAFVNYLIAPETIEHRICEMLQEKQEIISSVLDGADASPELNLFEMFIDEMSRKLAA